MKNTLLIYMRGGVECFQQGRETPQQQAATAPWRSLILLHHKVLMTFKVGWVSNEERGDSARGHGRSDVWEKKEMERESKKEEIWRHCHRIFPPPAVVLSLPVSQSLLIVTHHSNPPQTNHCTPPPPPLLSLLPLLSLFSPSFHTNDSVKQVKCYKIPPAAQPA